MTSVNPITIDDNATTSKDRINFYNPDKNEYKRLSIGSDEDSHGTLESFAKTNLFPVEAPDFLSGKRTCTLINTFCPTNPYAMRLSFPNCSTRIRRNR